jgi:hypothetical protein
VSWLTRSLPLLADPLSAPSDPCQVTFLTRQVEGLLRAEANANATMVSISINDNTQQCADEQELAVRRAEGADSGPMIRAINVIATAISAEFPAVLLHNVITCGDQRDHVWRST